MIVPVSAAPHAGVSSPALTPAQRPADAVELARVLEAWGIKGWVRILPHQAQPDALLKARTWWLEPPEAKFAKGFSLFAGCVEVAVAECKPHADGWVARLEGVNDRNTAEALKGVRISVPRSAFPPPAEGEYYWVDLLGLDVINREGVNLGRVTDLLATGPTSVLVLQDSDPADSAKTIERMIPFVDAYVDAVDTTARRITVDWQADY